MLQGVLVIFLGQLGFLVLDGSTGVGDVHRAIDQGGDTRSGTAAADGDHDTWIDGLVRLGPGLGNVDQGVGTLVLDQGALFAAAAGSEDGSQRGRNQQHHCVTREHLDSPFFMTRSLSGPGRPGDCRVTTDDPIIPATRARPALIAGPHSKPGSRSPGSLR